MTVFPAKHKIHIEDLKTRWIKLFPFASGWQLQDLAGRLEKAGRINRILRGWYARVNSSTESSELGTITQKMNWKAWNDQRIERANISSSPFPPATPNLFTDLQRIEARSERKIAAIWKFIEAMKAKGVDPTQELFDALYNDING